MRKDGGVVVGHQSSAFGVQERRRIDRGGDYGKRNLWSGVGAGGECDVDGAGRGSGEFAAAGDSDGERFGGQLGLVDPGVQKVIITPVVATNLPTGSLGPTRRIEFTLPASAIEVQLPTLGMGSVEELFAAAWDSCTTAIFFTSKRLSPRILRERLTFMW